MPANVTYNNNGRFSTASPMNSPASSMITSNGNGNSNNTNNNVISNGNSNHSMISSPASPIPNGPLSPNYSMCK